MKDPERLIENEKARKRYRENRETVERRLDKKRERYKTDPAYKEAIKESVKRQRAAKPVSDKKRSFNRDRITQVDGTPVVLWSIGKAANYIGVSKKTLEAWDRQTLIPRNKITDEIGRRWYPQTYVIFIASLFAARSPKERSSEWQSRVKAAWVARQGGPDPIPVVCERNNSDG